MYGFVDTTEVFGSASLPSEALKINGEYIESLIPGYRTLGVSGREALSTELSTYETGTRDGSTISSKRYPARTILVRYQLIAETSEYFREAYNKLAGILNVTDAELIFADEADKFFIGTPSAVGEIEPGMNAVVGEFEIFCADPFKYSVEEYEVERTEVEYEDDDGNPATAKMFVIDYGGTYKSFPTLETTFYNESETSADGETETELTGSGDCGYVAYITGGGKIIQMGDPEEVDTETVPASQTLVNQDFKASTGWGTAAKKLWKLNTALYTSYAEAQNGTLKEVKSPYYVTDGNYYLTLDNGGSGNGWHGATITRTIPADETGDVGASNFKLTYAQKMAIGSGSNAQKELGTFQALLVSGSGDSRKIVAGVAIYKNKNGTKANLRFYVNGKVMETIEIDMSYHNKYMGNNRAANKANGITAIASKKTSTITKSGKKVAFNICGISKTWTVSDETFNDLKATEITFTFAEHSTRPRLSFNGLFNAKFVKNKCETWKDVPNKFSAGDVLVAKCASGEILLNDLPSPELGALGNDWEEFCLTPGINRVSVAHTEKPSDVFAPTFKMKYREVFI